ncbi:MAG: hypothetical protein GF331_06260 [Chitinivibrionales bacterium]|nr:hypothetical protein [Chitinivibrionales bacterium]
MNDLVQIQVLFGDQRTNRHVDPSSYSVSRASRTSDMGRKIVPQAAGCKDDTPERPACPSCGAQCRHTARSILARYNLPPVQPQNEPEQTTSKATSMRLRAHSHAFLLAVAAGLAAVCCDNDGPVEPPSLPVTPADLSLPHQNERCLTGVIHASHDIAAVVDTFASHTGALPRTIGTYFDFTASPGEVYRVCTAIAATGAQPYITLDQKIWTGLHAPDSAIPSDSLLAGAYDTFLRAVADTLLAFGDTVVLRFNHEHNGDWYPYSVVRQGGGADSNGNDTCDGIERYVESWRYVHNLFTRAGAANVRWFYCVNAESFPDKPWNRPFSAYPGDSFVDLVGLDVYSHASTGADVPSAAQLCVVFVDDYRELGLEKPVAIGELGCNEIDNVPEMKAGWIREAFEVAWYMGAECMWYFDCRGSTADFRLITEQCREAYRDGMALDSAYFK